MAIQNDTKFNGNTYIAATFKHFGYFASGLKAAMMGIVSDYLEIGVTGLAIKLMSGLRGPMAQGSSVTLTKNDLTYIVDGSTSTVTLPAGVDGVVYAIKNSDGITTTTITPDGADTIDGAASYTLTASNDGIIIQYNADLAGWQILAAVAAATLPDSVTRWVDAGLVNYTDVADAGPTHNFNLYTLPGAWGVSTCKILPITSFLGGGATLVTGSVGVAGDEANIGTPFDIFQSAGATTTGITNPGFMTFNQTADTQLVFRATETGGNLEDLTQGQCRVLLLLSKAA